MMSQGRCEASDSLSASGVTENSTPKDEATEADSGDIQRGCQGPHEWRKNLRPVVRRGHGSSDNDTNLNTGEATENPVEIEKSQKGHLKRRPSREERSDDGKGKAKSKKEASVVRNSSFKGVGNHSAPSQRRSMSASNSLMETPFQRLVNRPTSPTTKRRLHGQPSQRSQDKKSGSAGVAFPRRSASLPSGELHPSAGTIKKRIEKTLKARLYLLQQTGPNSFLIGGDSPDHKYRVIIGPQRCSCGRGPQCVHILFVMLRVFQLPDGDPCLWSKTLKNFEVETLFFNFRERRSSLIQNLSKKRRHSKVAIESRSEQEDALTEPTGASPEQGCGDLKDEEVEDTCPICLLEMVEGESLTECVHGCQNKLHHHCIAVWFEECRRQNEPLICPLCRAQWKQGDSKSSDAISGEALPVPPNTRASSPQPTGVHHESYIELPHTEPIPPEQFEVAQPWIPVLGEELVSCLFSRNWVAREIGLKQLGRLAVSALLLAIGDGRPGAVVSDQLTVAAKAMLKCCCSVLAHMCADPVYKVFVAGLKTLRNVLAYTPCRNAEQQERLQLLLKPVIQTLLLKCADSNKRTSQLSLSALQELVKGQQGELAVGREIVNPGDCGVGGVSYMVDVLYKEREDAPARCWQWLLGRLHMLLRLLEEYPTEFMIQVPMHDNQSLELRHYQNYERILMVQRFCMSCLGNGHQKVGRHARRCFLTCARLQVHYPVFLRQVMDLLDGLPLDMQASLRQRMHRLAAEYNIAQHVVGLMRPQDATYDSYTDGDSSKLFSSPAMSEQSSPRSTTPEPKPISVTVNNFIQGNLNFLPNAPPNSPSRRHMPHHKWTSTHEDDLSMQSEGTAVSSSDTALAGSRGEDHQTSSLGEWTDELPNMPVRGMPSGASATELGLPLTDDDGDADDEAFTEGNTSMSSLPEIATANTSVMTVDLEVTESICSQSAEGLSQCSGNATAASNCSTANLTGDFSDLNMSPCRPEENISFKTEVASGSPQHFPARRKSKEGVVEADENCHCKEEVEKEEAEALVEALEQSVASQSSLPFIPGLSRTDSQETLIIRVQDQEGDGIESGSDGDLQQPATYLEDVHWQRGPRLGSGGFSTCYQARDVKTGSLMCVKQIAYCRNSMSEQEQVMETVSEEISMMSRLNHPNIVRILGATRQGLHFFMFVEWMPGGSMVHLLERYGPFNEYVIINYTQQILRGLAYLHENHLLHRDLKGANMMVDSSGQKVRIGDFGAAACLASRQTAAGEFQGQILGTIAFMAPEVLRGENYGRSCDVWSVGCVMIEMKTSKPPWGAREISNHLALIFKIASAKEHPPIPEGLSPALRDLLLRCLECSREDRPPARELLKHPLFTMQNSPPKR